MVEVSPDHPAALLSLLPDSEMYAYISLDAVAGRPDLEEHVEFQLGHFVSLDELPLAEKLLVSIGADALVLSYPFQFHGWAIILAGDFTRLAEALTMSARAGTGLSVSVVDSHRDIDIYSLLRTKASGYETEIYLAVVDSETLAASPDPDAVRNVVDRHNDGGQLPEGLGALVEDWGLGDFLEAFAIVGTSGQGRPTDSALVYAFHAELGAESTTTFRSLQQFGDETEAAAAAAWLNEQDERRYREIGWGDSVAIDGQWQVEGKTVYGEATVPDEDLPHLKCQDRDGGVWLWRLWR